jgi:hypothetical protein
MPTHRDHPWDQDARARRREASLRGRPARPRPTWRIPIAVACVAAVALLGLTAYGDRALETAATTTPRSNVTGAVTGLHSRLSRSGKLELWGSTTAPDGATIEMSAQSRGFVINVHTAPAISGHFYGSTHVPGWVRGGRVTVSAVVAP